MLYICNMQDVHLSSLDLNLLVVLESLLDTRSVTTTADRVGLSQSATSHALARLRTALADPLFVRSRAGLVPTERALALATPLRDALDRLRRVVAPPTAFDPAIAKRRFVLSTADYGELVLMPTLVARLARTAPGIDLSLVASEDDPFEQLARGESDAFIGPMRMGLERADIRERRLFDEHFVCIVREGHPKADKAWTLAEFAALDHALISPRARPGGTVDTLLEQHGLSRRVAITLPHFLVAPFIVAGTDLVLTIPERVARTFAAFLPLRLVEPPADVPGFTMALIWHERRHSDPAHAWLRGELAAVAKEIDVGATKPGARTSPLHPSRRAKKRTARGQKTARR
jgi:DNA-binding transcriptional LysR family regulator